MEIQSDEVEQVKLPSITTGTALELIKSTWHVLLAVIVGVAYIASYKASLDAHLINIDKQLQVEDYKLNWIIDHHSAQVGRDVPEDPRIVPQSKPMKPQSYARPHQLAEADPTIDAGSNIPVHY